MPLYGAFHLQQCADPQTIKTILNYFLINRIARFNTIPTFKSKLMRFSYPINTYRCGAMYVVDKVNYTRRRRSLLPADRKLAQVIFNLILTPVPVNKCYSSRCNNIHNIIPFNRIFGRRGCDCWYGDRNHCRLKYHK